VLESISRLMNETTRPEHRAAAQSVRELLAAYREHEDLISIGAYRRGSNRLVDVAVELQTELNLFLRQRIDEGSSVDKAAEALAQLQRRAAARAAAPAQAVQGQAGQAQSGQSIASPI